MVAFETDPDRIKQIMKSNFALEAKKYEIDQGVVNVPKWSVRSFTPMDHLPVQFGYVQGSFDVSGSQLISLEGSPHTVDGGFYCRNLKITNLVGGAKHVKGDYWCTENPQLESLEGCPETLSGKFIVRYTPTLHLLRLLQYSNFHVQKIPFDVGNILQAFRGQGKPGAIRAAVMLIKAGYKDNAKW
jgi:hypothetical protein